MRGRAGGASASARGAVRLLFVSTALAMCLAHLHSYLTADAARLVTRFSDDAYYYFRIARNFAMTRMMTFDGWSRTNGFQPLWQVSLLPIFMCVEDRIAVLRLVGVIDTVVLSGTVVLGILSLSKDLPPLPLALSAALMLRFISRFITQGMETTILVPLLLLTTWYAASLARQALLPHPLRRRVLLSMLLALLQMARLDAVLFVGLLVVMFLALTCSMSERRACLPTMLAVAGAPAVVGLVYLAMNWFEFGHLLPISAAAKSALRVHLNLRMVAQMLEVSSIQDVTRPRSLYLFLLLLCLVYLVMFAAAIRRQRGWRLLIAEHLAPLTVSAGAVFLWVYYLVGTSWALWDWYHYPAPAIAAIVLPALHREAQRYALPGRLQRAFADSKAATFAALALGAVVLVFGVRRGNWVSGPVEHNFLYQSFSLAERMRRELGPQASLAMGDRGAALAYFWDGNVLQLEGLVGDFETLEAIRTNRLEPYMDALGVEYLVAYGGPPGSTRNMV